MWRFWFIVDPKSDAHYFAWRLSQMKILVSAIACNPFHGSESYFGWAAVQCLGRQHHLHVITSGRNQTDLERAREEGMVPENVQFYYAGTFKTWHPNRLLARVQSWREYIVFARDSLRVAREIASRESLDVAHHVTYSTWRVASPLWQLGIPFVYGPIAGNEPFPFRLFPVLSFTGAGFELARKCSNVFSRRTPAVRQSLRRAAHVFAITEESERMAAAVRGSSDSISRLSPGFYSPERVESFARHAVEKDPVGKLKIYAAGSLGGQKCIAVAFHGLALARKRGLDFEYLLGSSGPEIPHLKKLALKLGLEGNIVFGGTMTRQAYQETLGRTHVYLLPSMRETVGLTMMEAMLAGCVPVVADNGGPRVTVTDECGFRIPTGSVKNMARAIADIMMDLDRDRNRMIRMGQAASKRIATVYTENHYLEEVNAVYREICKRV